MYFYKQYLCIALDGGYIRAPHARSPHYGTSYLGTIQTAGGTVRTVRSTRGNTGTRAGPNGAIGWITGRLDPRVGPLHREKSRVARRGTQGGLNCLTHVLPRCLPTPTEEADGGGAGMLSPGGEVPWAAVWSG